MDPQQMPSQPSIQKKGINPWMIISLVLFVVLVAAGAYYFGKMQAGSAPAMPSYATPSPSFQTQTSPTPSAAVSPTSTSGTGSVSGTLCYPSSMIPQGTITAKDTASGKETTQSYPGTQAGGGTTYTMQLSVGVYHMKFTSTQYSTVVGYYTDYSTCVGNPTGPNCTGQKTRPLLPVQITAGQETTKVNLCDFYYPSDNPPQF